MEGLPGLRYSTSLRFWPSTTSCRKQDCGDDARDLLRLVLERSETLSWDQPRLANEPEPVCRLFGLLVCH
jgi:hypothetical protein